MRSYGQYCAVAKALDVVGDRWSLLIVRELLLHPCRYRDLQDGLPGIATNLLAERLRSLEEAGVCRRDAEGRYALTEWGAKLAVPMGELVRWAAPLMRDRAEGDAFRVHWLELPLALVFAGHDSSRPDLDVEIRIADQMLTVTSRSGKVTIRPGPAVSPDVVISGPPETILGLLTGRLNKPDALKVGAHVLGDLRKLARLRKPDWLDSESPLTRESPDSAICKT